jgi:hypothetical protein
MKFPIYSISFKIFQEFELNMAKNKVLKAISPNIHLEESYTLSSRIFEIRLAGGVGLKVQSIK